MSNYLYSISAVLFLVAMFYRSRYLKYEERARYLESDNRTMKYQLSRIEEDAKKWQKIKADLNGKPNSAVIDELRSNGWLED